MRFHEHKLSTNIIHKNPLQPQLKRCTFLKKWLMLNLNLETVLSKKPSMTPDLTARES